MWESVEHWLFLCVIEQSHAIMYDTGSLNTQSNYYCGGFCLFVLQIIMTPIYWPPTIRSADSMLDHLHTLHNLFPSKSLQGMYNYPTSLIRKVLGECTNFSKQTLNKKLGWEPKPANLFCHSALKQHNMNLFMFWRQSQNLLNPYDAIMFLSVPGILSVRCYRYLH